MNHGYAPLERIMGVLEVTDFPIELDGPAIFLVNAEQTLHQRRLASPILTHQGMHRSRLNP
ncbi:hypothetical protein SDC9_115668 [bioreactor metagenome]|uniref:Uncharacterized protein n=1 Tax=bioreactor metagenome TaxID=1076179 RepID=A0A645C453_9ZZZZ